MILDTLAQHKAAFLRLAGTIATDQALTENGEGVDDVFLLFLTRGYRAAQRTLLDYGLSDRWRARYTIPAWGGSETTDGGRFVALPTDFLRTWGTADRMRPRSAIASPDGTSWGSEIAETDSRALGHFYYLKNSQLWVTRGASPPSNAVLEYHFAHPDITAGFSAFDMPEDARWLCVAEGVADAMNESWFPRASQAEVQDAVKRGREQARAIARRSRTPIQMRRAQTAGSHW